MPPHFKIYFIVTIPYLIFVHTSSKPSTKIITLLIYKSLSVYIYKIHVYIIKPPLETVIDAKHPFCLMVLYCIDYECPLDNSAKQTIVTAALITLIKGVPDFFLQQIIPTVLITQ